ncbi:Cyanovirin-N [Tirmania nivea]|nr:Cyanovirin-N [Tirmania nivea]
MAGGFHMSSVNIKLSYWQGNPPYLESECRDESGYTHQSRLNLDECIGNINGYFAWGGRGFSRSARNIKLEIEGSAQVPILRAELYDLAGNWNWRDISLTERISNFNGQMYFKL